MQFWYNYIVNVFGRIEVFMKENINRQFNFYIWRKISRKIRYTKNRKRRGLHNSSTSKISFL